MRLEGKIALVTGAAHERGIGRGIVLALAGEGCDVAVNDVGVPGHGRGARRARAFDGQAGDVRRGGRLGSGPGRRDGRASRTGARAARHRLLERRRRRLAGLDGDLAGVARPNRGREPDRRVQRRPVGGAGDGRARLRWAHRLHVLRSRADGLSDDGRVRSDEAGSPGSLRDDGGRARRARDNREPHRPRLGEVAAERRLARAAYRGGRGRRRSGSSRSRGRPSRSSRGARSCTSARRTATTSPASSSAWTAASWWGSTDGRRSRSAVSPPASRRRSARASASPSSMSPSPARAGNRPDGSSTSSSRSGTGRSLPPRLRSERRRPRPPAGRRQEPRAGSSSSFRRPRFVPSTVTRSTRRWVDS